MGYVMNQESRRILGNTIITLSQRKISSGEKRSTIRKLAKIISREPVDFDNKRKASGER